jgi:hypothetical protein
MDHPLIAKMAAYANALLFCAFGPGSAFAYTIIEISNENVSAGNHTQAYGRCSYARLRKGGTMKTMLIRLFLWALFSAALLLAGFSTGFEIGQRSGFTKGGEWSIMQADLLAREAGVFMPVSYSEGTFHVVVKQPRHLYRNAQKLAEKHEKDMAYVNTGKKGLSERVQLAQGMSLVQ